MPAGAAIGARLIGIPVYGGLLWTLPEVAFLHHMAITFPVLSALICACTWLRPWRRRGRSPSVWTWSLTPSPGVRLWGTAVVAATAGLYILFW